MNIEEYIIVTDLTPLDLAVRVREKIIKGYQPFGNMVYTSLGYHQPMVRYSS